MSIHEIEAKTIQGQSRSLKDYEGNLLLVVNVASKCGLTPQYKDLENLYKKYKDRGVKLPILQFFRRKGTDNILILTIP